MAQAAQDATERLNDYNAIFEAYLTEATPEATLMKHEKVYLRATKEEKLTPQIQFDYAVCLIKSRNAADMQKPVYYDTTGIILLEDLSIGNPEGNRDYFFFLSLGNARLKNYTIAIKYLTAYSMNEPDNNQMAQWKKFLEAKMKKEAKIGMAVATGSALVIGGLVGLGLTLLKLTR